LLYCLQFFPEVRLIDSGLVRLKLKTDTFSVDVLPALGGKIASMRQNGIELLQQPLLPYAPRTLSTAFEDSDASGFDECLPSVSACEIESPSGRISVPDHGEFWRLACDSHSPADNELHLVSTGSVLPLRFERKLRLVAETGRHRANTLHIEYRVENIGQHEIQYAWSAHPLFAVDPGDHIDFPPSVNTVKVENSARRRLGVNGAVHPWPFAQLTSGELAHLDRVGHEADKIGDKLYAVAPASDGWCAIERRSAGLRVQVEFDPKLTPWLGLWLCYGGWPENRALRQYCVALEPCTSPVDSLVGSIAAGHARTLAPGQCDSWWMRIVTSVVS
jgi:hypothetical protein